MPEDRQEALRFRRDFAARGFSCGVWLGGCGESLTARVGRERIPHFSHIPVFPEHVCRRKYTEADSADHLYITGDLQRWLAAQGQPAREADLHGDFESGDTCRTAVIDTVVGRGRIRVDFLAGSAGDAAQGGPFSWQSRLYGEKVAPTQSEIRSRGHVLRVRSGRDRGAYRTEIGTAVSGKITWTPLEDCTLTSRGITTPHMPAPTTPAAVTRTASGPAALPLDVETILVRPRYRGTSIEKMGAPPGRRFRLPADVEAPVPTGTGEVVLWFPEHVGGLKKGHAYRLLPPAWIDLERRENDTWPLCAQGLVPEQEPLPPASGGVPEPRNAEDALSPNSQGDTGESVPPPPEPSSPPPSPDLAEGEPDGPSPLERLAPQPAATGNTAGKPPRFLQRWATLAVMPESTIREEGSLDDDHRRRLGLLLDLGERWIEMCLADVLARDFLPVSEETERRWILGAKEHVLEGITRWPRFREEVRFRSRPGQLAGEHDGKRTVLRLMGAFALNEREPVIRALVDRAYGECREPEQWHMVGCFNELVAHLGGNALTVSYSTVGVGTGRQVQAMLKDRTGRSATGRAATRAGALDQAAQAFSQRHLSWPVAGVVRRRHKPVLVPSRKRGAGTDEVVQVSARLREAGLSEQAVRALLRGVEAKVIAVTDEHGKVRGARVHHYAWILGELLRTNARATSVMGAGAACSAHGTPDFAPLPEQVWSAVVKEQLPRTIGPAERGVVSARLLGALLRAGGQEPRPPSPEPAVPEREGIG